MAGRVRAKFVVQDIAFFETMFRAFCFVPAIIFESDDFATVYRKFVIFEIFCLISVLLTLQKKFPFRIIGYSKRILENSN